MTAYFAISTNKKGSILRSDFIFLNFSRLQITNFQKLSNILNELFKLKVQ